MYDVSIQLHSKLICESWEDTVDVFAAGRAIVGN